MKNSPPLSIVLLLMCLNSTLAQQKDVSLSGIVVLQNSAFRNKGTVSYITGAFVRSPVQSTPTITDSKGAFTLVFADKPVGDVAPLTVRKAGLEVVNKRDLENATVIGRLSSLKVAMSKPEELDDNRAAYYEISHRHAEQVYQNRLASLKKEGKLRQRTMDSLATEFNRKINSAEEATTLLAQQRDQMQRQAQELAERFVIVNLDDENDTYQRAFLLFTEGAVDKAIQILDSINLPKRLADNSKIIEKSTKIINEIQAQKQTAVNQIQDDISNSILKARLHCSRFQFKEAVSSYALALQYDSLNLEYLNEYTEFLVNYGEYGRSLGINQQALAIAQAAIQRGDSVRIRRDLAF